MLYFELFDLKPHFNVDANVLKKRYYALSKSTHPDFHTLSSSDEQAIALEHSTNINLAYKTLGDEDKLLAYILNEHKLIQEDQGNQIPQVFLMEMMDINEAIMELEFDPNDNKKSEIKDQFAKMLSKEKSKGQLIKDQYDKFLTNEVLVDLKDHYFKMKYLNRISQNLS